MLLAESITDGTLSPNLAIPLVIGGILLSLVLPVAVATLKKATPKFEAFNAAAPPSIWRRLAEAWARWGGAKYVAIVASATLIALVIVFVLDWKFHTYRDAILAGFAWESLINKLFKTPPAA